MMQIQLFLSVVTPGPNMYRLGSLFIALVLSSVGGISAVLYANEDSSAIPSYKPRVITTTDLGADPDDEQSLVRFLVSSNEFDIEGLVVSTGCWKKTQDSTKMLDKIVQAYGDVVGNLNVHAKGYPTYEYLKSISVMGQRGYGMDDVGEGKDSPGSDLIIASVDKDDPRPVWLGCWGGANCVAQAIWKVKSTRSEKELTKFLSKLRVFDILGQDDAGVWIAKNYPDLMYIRATAVYGWAPSDEYLSKHVQSHGPLGAVYPNRKWATEGDSPAFMYLFPNGLSDPEDISQGNWGGRFNWEKTAGIRSMEPVKNESSYDPYHMYGNSFDGANAIKRWSVGYNNDFEARMDWSTTSNYSDANHHPIAIVNGDKTRHVLKISALAGSSVTLQATGSSDPDGNGLNYFWSFYREPSSHQGAVTITGGETESATVTIPKDATGKTIHIVLTLHDDGTPNLYAYRRVILNVSEPLPKVLPPSQRRLRVVVSTDMPPIGVVKEGDVSNDQKSDPDDLQSIVRFLLHSNEFDIEGLMATSATFANVARKKCLLDVIDRYGLVYENLKTHDPLFPSPDFLRKITFQGLSGTWGKQGTENIGVDKDSEASQALIAIIDKPDPRPVYISVWGDCSLVAQAIWKVQRERSPEQLESFLSKIRIHQIATQDGSIDWLKSNFPSLFIIHSKKTYFGMFGANDPCSDLNWINENIRANHGSLCSIYPPEGIGCTGVCEGDTPAFLWLLSANRGLSNPEDPTQESWGGQFVKQAGTNHFEDGPGPTSISKWRRDFQAEFQQRADWCVRPETSTK